MDYILSNLLIFNFDMKLFIIEVIYLLLSKFLSLVKHAISVNLHSDWMPHLPSIPRA